VLLSFPLSSSLKIVSQLGNSEWQRIEQLKHLV
jgi:hypothetical protein